MQRRRRHAELHQQRRPSKPRTQTTWACASHNCGRARIHTWKIGIDANRENSEGSQTYACTYVDCNLPGNTTPAIPATPANGYPLGYFAATSSQAQPGSQIGIYAQDKWQPSQNVAFDYGLRYDHSTGYTSGYMIEPRIGVNVSDGGKNVYHMYYGRYYAAPLLEDVRQACVIFAAQSGCATTAPPYDLQPEMDSYYEIGTAAHVQPQSRRLGEPL